MVKYEKNFLTNVIARVDFPNPIKVHESLPPDLSKAILELFPISESRKILGKTLKFTGEKIEIEGDEKSIEWNFFGKNREKQLVITPIFFYISYTKYESYNSFKSDFISVIEKIFEVFSDIQITRLGLRYINEISLLDQIDPLNWTEYLNEKLLSPFEVAGDKSTIARCINNLFLNQGDMNLNFRYGMHNPDMPAPIKKKIFILDYDAHNTNLQDISEIREDLEKFHNIIISLFENHIEEGLRTIMHVTNR